MCTYGAERGRAPSRSPRATASERGADRRLRRGVAGRRDSPPPPGPGGADRPVRLQARVGVILRGAGGSPPRVRPVPADRCRRRRRRAPLGLALEDVAGEQMQPPGRHVGDDGRDHVDGSRKEAGKAGSEVALVDLDAVGPRGGGGRRVDLGPDDPRPWAATAQHHRDGAGAGAQVDRAPVLGKPGGRGEGQCLALPPGDGPGWTWIFSPQKRTEPVSQARGSPAHRRRTRAPNRATSPPAASRSSSASSSAATHPARRSAASSWRPGRPQSWALGTWLARCSGTAS